MSQLFAVDFSNNALLDDNKGFDFIGWDMRGTGMSMEADNINGQGGNGLIVSPVQNLRILGAKRVNNLTYIRQAYYLNPNGITIPTTRDICIARNYHNDASRCIYRVCLKYTDGEGYAVYASVDSNTTAPMYTSSAYVLDNQTSNNVIEIDLNCNDTTGLFRLWINGTLKWSRTVVNGNLRVNYPCIGALSSNYAMSGTFKLSYWCANDDGAELNPPKINSASIENANPNRLMLVFSEALSSQDFSDGWTVNVNGSPATISDTALQSDNVTLWITLSAEVANSDTVSVTYSKTLGSITDSAGNTLSTYTNYTVTNNIGVESIGSFDFNGSSDRLDFSGLSDLRGQQLSIDFDWKSDGFAGNADYLLCFHQPGDAAYGLTVYLNANGNISYYWPGTTPLWVIGSTAAFGTGWHHLTINHDGSTTATNVHIYHDGAEVSYTTRGNGANLVASTGTLSIGGRIYDDTRNFDGHMEMVKIYNVQRTPQQITDANNHIVELTDVSRIFWWKGNSDSVKEEVSNTNGTKDGTNYVLGDGVDITYV